MSSEADCGNCPVAENSSAARSASASGTQLTAEGGEFGGGHKVFRKASAWLQRSHAARKLGARFGGAAHAHMDW